MTVTTDWRVYRDSLQVPSSVAVDAEDRLYVGLRSLPDPRTGHRDESRINVITPDGETSTITLPHVGEIHHLSVHSDILIVTDRKRHAVFLHDLGGTLRRTFGTPDVPTPTQPFYAPTQAVLSRDGEYLFVSDGYQNSRVHVFTASGRLLHSWGSPGAGLGQFQLPHSLRELPNGTLVVCDRENSRLQCARPDGSNVQVLAHAHRPTDIVYDTGKLYVTTLDRTVLVLAENGSQTDSFSVPGSAHSLAVTSAGVIYVAHVRGQCITQIVQTREASRT